MANTRIQNLKPPCDYTLEGLTEILIVDLEDFQNFRFSGGSLYDNCLVKVIVKSAPFVDVAAPDGASYSSAIEGRIYVHTLETFVAELSAEILSDLNLGAIGRRRFVVFFGAKTGKYFTFGYETGATITYTGRTAGEIGAAVIFRARSIYPLFEVDPLAITGRPWVLVGGVWNNNGAWYADGIWEY